ncbi:MAG: hypothetical protein CM15mP119_2630 [Alphaproteobacteria bacterium]|nr:MAG: hypothetical protein CM15mP119_2630 [Alphaproteobacteria bacterium]
MDALISFARKHIFFWGTAKSMLWMVLSGLMMSWPWAQITGCI